MGITVNEESGTIVCDGIAIGSVKGKEIMLNAGWMKMADVGVIVYGDPESDRRKVLLDRRRGDTIKSELGSSNGGRAEEPSPDKPGDDF